MDAVEFTFVRSKSCLQIGTLLLFTGEGASAVDAVQFTLYAANPVCRSAPFSCLREKALVR